MNRPLRFLPVCILFFLFFGLSLSSFSQAASAVIDATNPKHETLNQNQIAVLFDEPVSGSSLPTDWTVTINGTPVTVLSAVISGSTVNVTFDAILVNPGPDVLPAAGVQSPLLPGQTLRISFTNASGLLKTTSNGNSANSFGLSQSKNNYYYNCDDLGYSNSGNIATVDVCAPVDVNFFQWTYFLSLRMRNSAWYQPTPNVNGAFKLIINYGDPAATNKVYYPFQADGAAIPMPSTTYYTIGSLQSGLSGPVLSMSIKPNDFSYPDNSGLCSFNYTITPEFHNLIPCGIGTLSRTGTFISYDNDDENTGTVLILPSVTDANLVCLGTNANITYSDNTTLNCQGPPLPASITPTTANQNIRWMRVVYGYQNAPGPGNIPNIVVGGVPVTNASGLLIAPFNANPLLGGAPGYVPTGGGGVGVPDANGVIQFSTPVTIATGTAFIKNIITSSFAGQVFDQRFYVRIDYWNICNQYDGVSTANAVSKDHFIQIIQSPPAPTVNNPIVCENTTTPGVDFNITASATGTGTLTYTWYKEAALTTILQGPNTDNTFNPVTEGPTADKISQTVIGSQIYHRYVTVTQGSNNCTSPAADITIRIDDTNTGGVIAHPLGATPILICSGTDPNPFTSTTAGTGGAPGGTLTYQWQSATNSTFTAGLINIAGANSNVFDPPLLASAAPSSIFYRRRVSSGSCADVFSNVIEFKIYTPAQGGSIGNAQILCSGGDPAAITNVTAGTGGTGTPSYIWQMSSDNFGVDINTIAGQTGATYDPPVLTTTTYYRRVNTSGSPLVCALTSAAYTLSVEMTVNQPVVPGVIDNAQMICSGDDPTVLTEATAPSGGDGIAYTFQWQISNTGGGAGFTSAPGASTGSTYDPPVLTATRYYRRQVSSGVCPPTFSNEIKITVNPLPGASVTGGGSACQGTAATDIVFTFTGTPPYNIVIEVASTPDVPDITLTNYNSNTYTIVAPNPTATTTYKVLSLTDNNTCPSSPAGLGGTATVTPQLTAPPSVETFLGDPAVCDNGPSTNPPDAKLDLAPNSAENYNISYRLYRISTSSFLPGTITLTNQSSTALGEVTISPSYSDFGAAPTDPQGYQVVITAIQNSVTLCAGAVPINGPVLIINAPPVITTQPTVAIQCSGLDVTYSVAATGTLLSYQWQEKIGAGAFTDLTDGTVGGMTYTGSTSSTLSITNVTASGRQYHVIVTSFSGTTNCPVTSNDVTLTINPLPTVSNRTPSVCSDNGGGTTATVNLTTQQTLIDGTAGRTFAWFENYDPTTKIFSTPITTPASYSVTHLTPVFVRVTNPATGCVSPATVTYTVNPKAVIDPFPATEVVCVGDTHVFNATVSGPPGLTLKWQENGVDIVNGTFGLVTYSGASTSSLTVSGITSAKNGRIFSVVATTTGPCPITRTGTTLTVNPLPVVSNVTPAPCSDIPGGTQAVQNLTNYNLNSGPNTGVSADAGTTTTVTWWLNYTVGVFSNPIPAGNGAGQEENYTVSNGDVLFARVEDNTTHCINMATATFTVKPRPFDNEIRDGNGTTIASVATSGASYNLCANNSTSITFQTVGTINPGSTFTWTVPPVSYANEFVYSGAVGKLAVFEFPNSTDGNPASLYQTTGIPITVTETLNGCTGNPITIYVHVLSAPTAPTLSGDAYVCEGGIASYSASIVAGTSSYDWTLPTGSTFITAFPATSSTISVKIGSQSGVVKLKTANAICPSPNDVTFPVVVSPNPVMDPITQPVSVCSGEKIISPKVKLGSNVPGSTFNWKVLSIAGSITGVNPGDFANNVTEIDQTPINISGVGASITYQVIPVSPDTNPDPTDANYCTGNPLTFTVDVNPVPVLSLSQSKTICNNQPVNKEILLTPTNLPAGTSFSWPDPDGAGPASAKTIAMGVSGTLHITDILTNTTDNPLVVTYHVTPTNGLCAGAAIDIPITVEPTPKVDTPVTNNAPSICSNASPDFTFTTPTVPTNINNLKFDVSLFSLPAGVVGTGVANTGVTDVSASPSYQFTGGTLVNNNATSRTVVYRITPKLSGCANGAFVDVSVVVEPTPQVTVLNSSPRICNTGTPDFTLSSSTISSTPTDLTYNIIPTIPAGITATGNALTGATGVTNASLPFNFTGGTLTNTTDSRITVTYEVVPLLAGCADGTSKFATVVVEPSPKANTPTNLAPVICSGGKPNFNFTTPTVPNTPSDLTFDVTVGALPTGISGTGAAITGVFGVSASAATAYIFNSGTLTNSGASVQTVTYTITPRLNGCADGNTQQVDVIVQPIPRANIPTNNAAVICNGGTPNFTFTSPTVANAPGDLTFDVTLNTPLPSGVSGTGIAITGVTDVTADAVTPYVFNAGSLSNSDDNFKTVTYTITPKLNGCGVGPTQTVTVKIEPTPRANVPINNAPVICNGGSPDFSFTSPTLTTTQSDLTFDVAANLPLPTGVTGTNLSVTGVSASAITPYVFNTATLTNSGDAFQTVTFTITPQLSGCAAGPTRTVDVKVEPTPRFTFTNSPSTICNGGVPNIAVSTPTIPVVPSDLTFDVAVTLNGVTGTGVAVNGLTGTTAPFFINSGTLVNSSNIAKTVKYTVTPKLAGCPSPGAAQDIFVVVEPTPSAIPTNHSIRVCNGGSPNIEVNTSTVPSVPAALTFDVTVNLNGVLGTLQAGNGIVGATGPQFFINTGILTNTTNSSKTVRYTITPKLSGCPSGTPIDIDVIVEPTPAVSFTNISPRLCNGGTPNVLITSTTAPSNAADLTFDVVAVLPTGVTGTLRAGNGVTGATVPFSINTGVLTNSNNAFADVEYQITAMLNGCPAGTSQSVFVIVEPTPQADVPVNNKPIICNGGTPDIEFTSPTTVSATSTLTFDVTIFSLPAGVSGSGDAVSGVSGATAPFSLNSGTLTNSNNTAKTVVYRITPKLNGCSNGPTKDVSVIVEPTPVATFANAKPSICSGDAPSITITSPTVSDNPSDLKFDITVSAPGLTGTGVAFNGITGVSSGYVINTGTLVHDNLSNVPVVVVYTITTRLINARTCADGTPVQVNVTVRPNPVGVSSTTASPSRDACSREGFTYDIQGDNIDVLGNQVSSKFTFTVTSSNEANVPTPSSLDRTVATTAGIVGNFTNKTNADVYITYHITPYDQSALLCAGVPFDIVAVINPEPKGALTTTITRCSGDAINYDIQTAIDDIPNGGNALPNSQFTYQITAVSPNGNDLLPAAFPGNFGRPIGSISDDPITEMFRNVSGHDVTITYSITPYGADPNRCDGTPFELKVVYHSEPFGKDFEDPLCATSLSHDIQTQITNGVLSEFTYTVSSDNAGVLAGPNRTVFSSAPITDTYANNTGTVANMTYTITARAAAAPNCTSTGPTFVYKAQIFPTPTAVATPLAATCSDQQVTIIPQSFVTNGVTITKYDWEVSYPSGLTGTLPASGSPKISSATGNIVFTMTNKTAGSLSVSIKITPYAGGCPGTDFTIVQSIDAEPVMSNSLSTSRCSGEAYGLNLATNGVYDETFTAVTYDVYVDDVPAGLTGTRVTNTVTRIGGGNSAANVIFNDIYTNNTAAPLIVKYRVIPRGGGCDGDALTWIEFTVKPSPVLLVTPPLSMCSTNSEMPSVTNIIMGTDGISVNAEKYRIDLIEYARTPDLSPADPFAASPSSPLFTFPSSNRPVGYVSAAGDIYMIRSDKFRNRTADPFVVRYTITPISAGGCEGVAGTVSIKVNPEPILDPALSPTPVCSGDKIDRPGFAFELRADPTSVEATKFIIKSINPNGLTAGTSNALIGSLIDKDGIDNDTWVNTISPSFVPVVYTIIPITADDCRGEPQTVTININPAPGLKAGLDKLVCNGVNAGITLVDNSPVSAAAAQYRLAGVSVVTAGPTYTPITPGATVLGLTANAANRAVGFTGNSSLISADNYTNTTHDRIVVRYEIVAIATASGCEATGFVTLTIEPAIESSATIADNDICSSAQIAITFNTPSYANGETTNPVLTYSYRMVYVGPETSGISGNTIGNNLLKDASGIDIKDMLINSKDVPIKVKYIITPKAIAAAGGVGGGCTGTPQEIEITVQPRPKINPIADKTICYNTSAGLNLISTTVPSTGVIKFQLTSVVPETANVTGFSPVNTWFTNNAGVSDMLINSDVVQRYVDYTFEPVNVDAATNTPICVNGTPITVRVTVNPLPVVTSLPLLPARLELEICSGESIEVPLDVNTDAGSTIVKWTVSASSVVGASAGAGGLLFGTLLNNGSTPQVVTYTITPSFSNCFGAPQEVRVTVNPLPKFRTSSSPPVLPSRVTVCDGTVFNLNLLSYAVGATTFRWDVTDVNGLGVAANGSGTGINETLVNDGPDAATATLIYQITPLFVSASGKQCEGIPRTVTVSVAPKIEGSIEAMDPICEGTPVFMVINLKGQAPFDFDYNTIDVATNTVVSNTAITKSGNVKVIKVTPTADTKYEIVNVKDALGCPGVFSTTPSASIIVYKKVTAKFEAIDIPFFEKLESVVTFQNQSTPVDASVFNYEWTFGTDGYANPTTSTQANPDKVVYSRSGDHYVTLRAYNNSAPVDLGCESSYSKKITIPVKPLQADFEFDPKVACFPQIIKITENIANGDVMDWTVVDSKNVIVASSSAAMPEFKITTPGKYTIKLRTYDPFTGTQAFAPTAGKDFVIYDNPVASFDVRPTLVYVPDTELTTFNFSTGAPEYLWDFGDGSTSTEPEPKYTYKIEGIYDITLVAINDHGDGAVCTDTLSRKITAKQGGVTKVPNAFTPSPNGPSGGVAGNNTFNDVFLPIVKGAEEFNMQIFDRWGNLIFESNNSNMGWDGYDKNGKLMPAGVYVYKLTVRLSDGQRSTQLGDITMIR